MSDAAVSPKLEAPKVGRTLVAAPLMGLSIGFIGAIPWVVMARLNVRYHPEVPWAAAATICWLLIVLLWLGGVGWPRRTSGFRSFHLRLWRRAPGASSPGNLATILGLVCAQIGLTVFWIVIQSGRPPADVSVYPTTALRFSVLLIGPLVSGVVEEAAFRGYMQSHLEKIGPTFAILVTSAVFTLAHATHGISFLLAAAPGIFVVSVIYGYLALKAGSIIPGMLLHSVGDAAVAYFVLLGGHSALLFAG